VYERGERRERERGENWQGAGWGDSSFVVSWVYIPRNWDATQLSQWLAWRKEEPGKASLSNKVRLLRIWDSNSELFARYLGFFVGKCKEPMYSSLWDTVACTAPLCLLLEMEDMFSSFQTFSIPEFFVSLGQRSWFQAEWVHGLFKSNCPQGLRCGVLETLAVVSWEKACSWRCYEV
jgi:hypothetical protein